MQLFPLVVGSVGFGQSADGLGWIGSHKMDPWTTLIQLHEALIADASEHIRFYFSVFIFPLFLVVRSVL